MYVMICLLSVLVVGFSMFIILYLKVVYFGIFFLCTFIFFSVNIYMIKSTLKAWLDVAGVISFTIGGTAILFLAKSPLDTMTGILVIFFGVFLYFGGQLL